MAPTDWLMAYLKLHGMGQQPQSSPMRPHEAALLGLKPPPRPLGADTSFDMSGPSTGGVQAPGGSTPKRARMAQGLPEEVAARGDLFTDANFGLRWNDDRYVQASRDESRLANLLTQALNPSSRRFDSIDSGRSYQQGLQTNTTDNSRRGQRYATFQQGGNLYHEYVINGRRRRVLVGPADRKLF